MLNVGLLVVSSKIVSGETADTSRGAIEQMVTGMPGKMVAYACVPDNRSAIREGLEKMCETAPDVILTIGGTGVRPTDWTPEATRDVIEKELPGIGEAMRQESFKKVCTAMLSRGTAGIRGKALIVNLPGSARGAKENLDVILPILDHTIEKITGRTSVSTDV